MLKIVKKVTKDDFIKKLEKNTKILSNFDKYEKEIVYNFLYDLHIKPYNVAIKKVTNNLIGIYQNNKVLA